MKATLSGFVLFLLVLAGLWPHFSTQASWLAAALLAGVVFSLRKGYGQAQGPAPTDPQPVNENPNSDPLSLRERVRVRGQSCGPGPDEYVREQSRSSDSDDHASESSIPSPPPSPGGRGSSRARLFWFLFSMALSAALWTFHSTSQWIVIPEQLLPLLVEVPFSFTGLILALGASGAVVAVSHALSVSRPQWTPRLLAALAIVVFCVSGIGLGNTVRQLSRMEPADFSYNFDGIRYLKSFYLMKQGMDWYAACVESTRVDARGPFEVPRVVMNYRLPTLYGLFSFLPDGGWIQILFVLCSCCAMGAVFDAVLRIGGTDRSWLCGLAASLLLGSYLLTGAVTWYYTFHEYWAWFAAAGAWFFLVRRLDLPAFALAVFSAAIREHFVLVLAVHSIAIWLAGDRRNRMTVVGGWLLLAAVYLLHVNNAMPYTGQGIGEGTSIWFHAPSLNSIRYATLFGTVLLPYALYWIPLLFLGYGWAAWRYRAHRAVACVSVLIAVPFLGYVFVGPSISSGGYWGIVYMPWVLTLGPLAVDLDR